MGVRSHWCWFSGTLPALSLLVTSLAPQDASPTMAARCYTRSLMCDSGLHEVWARPLGYHYYLIARRQFCLPRPQWYPGY